MCYSMLMNRGSSLALFLMLFGSAPSQVRSAGIGQGENNPENEFDAGNRLVDSLCRASLVPVLVPVNLVGEREALSVFS